VPVTILTEAELRQCVRLDLELVDAIADAFTASASGRVVVPASLHVDLTEANAEVDVKTAWLPGLPSLALAVSSVFLDNHKRGLPSSSGSMLLLSAETGELEALLLDHGWLADLSTAAAGALTARHLARADATIAGVLGAGTQARLQLEALILVRPIERVLVWAGDPVDTERYADEMAERFGIDVLPVLSTERLVLEADIVVTATSARAPLVVADWLHPGLHITAAGADNPDKNELHPGVLARADRLVCNRRAQCARLGELHHALASCPDLDVTELGEITAGRKPGRQSPEEVTVADLAGAGVQDTAIALRACRRAFAAGFGTTIAH
jgi:ectoine utilization protein EutC